MGTKPDAEVGRLTGRPGKVVWAKRRALGIADAPSLVRSWTEDEDKVVVSCSPAEAAQAEKLLDFFLLEKAFYEVEYELTNRPGWIGVPLQGIWRILKPQEAVSP